VAHALSGGVQVWVGHVVVLSLRTSRGIGPLPSTLVPNPCRVPAAQLTVLSVARLTSDGGSFRLCRGLP
jgi:hypothetical protein